LSPDLEIRTTTAGVEFAVHVQPRAAREGVGGLHGGALRVRVHAAPAAGQANDAVAELVAGVLGVRRRDVILLSGQKSRQKRLKVNGNPETLRERIRALAGSD
jgi:uncharacterized protein (TIGR00251 family)